MAASRRGDGHCERITSRKECGETTQRKRHLAAANGRDLTKVCGAVKSSYKPFLRRSLLLHSVPRSASFQEAADLTAK